MPSSKSLGELAEPAIRETTAGAHVRGANGRNRASGAVPEVWTLASPTRSTRACFAVGAPRRYRNREHLRFVAQQPCLVCGRKPSDPHHLRFMQPRALGRKVSDEFAVPLCRGHHRAVHRAGDERAWWKAAGIDPVKVARKLWKQTHVNEGHLPGPDRTLQTEWRREQATCVAVIDHAGRLGCQSRAFSHRCWNGLRGSGDQRTPGNLARSQHPLSDMVAAPVLCGNRERRQRGSDQLGAQSTSKRERSSTVPSEPSMFVSPNTTITSISISPTSAGGRWRSAQRMADRRVSRPCVSSAPPACFRFPFRSEAGPSRRLLDFSIFPRRDEFVLVVAWFLAAIRAGGPIRYW